MGDLNNIQDEIYAEMDGGDLEDVAFPFSGSRMESDKPFDPENPIPSETVTYTGKGIFGLSFTQQDTLEFKIEENDQKAIAFKRYTTDTPKVQDEITYNGETYVIIHIVVIPADNGWVMQLRKYA